MKGARKNRAMFFAVLPSSAAGVAALVGDDIKLGGGPGRRRRNGFFFDEDFAKGGHGELLFFCLFCLISLLALLHRIGHAKVSAISYSFRC